MQVLRSLFHQKFPHVMTKQEVLILNWTILFCWRVCIFPAHSWSTSIHFLVLGTSSIALVTGVSHVQEFTNSHFHFRFLVEWAASNWIVDIPKSFTSLTLLLHPSLMFPCDSCRQQHGSLFANFRNLHHFLSSHTRISPSPYASLSWHILRVWKPKTHYKGTWSVQMCYSEEVWGRFLGSVVAYL